MPRHFTTAGNTAGNTADNSAEPCRPHRDGLPSASPRLPETAVALLVGLALLTGCRGGSDSASSPPADPTAARVSPMDATPEIPAEATAPPAATTAAVEITPSGPVPSADEIIRRAVAAEPEHSVLAVSIDTEITAPGVPDTGSRSRRWRQGDRSREEYAADSGLMPGKIEVDDGEARWAYLPESDSYMRTVGPGYIGLPDATAQPQAAPAEEDSLAGWLISPYDLSYDGMELVDGGAAYRLTGPPRGVEAPSPGRGATATVWIDAATFALLRARLVTSLGAMGTMTIDYDDFAFDPPIPDDFFTLTVPPGKDVMDLDMSDTSVSTSADVSLEEARQAVSFKLLEPVALPPGVALESVSISTIQTEGEPELRSVAMSFSGPGGMPIMLSQEPRNRPGADPSTLIDAYAEAGRAVEVNGHGGALDELAGIWSLRWLTDDAYLTLIAGTEAVDEATLLALAEGLR
jgi:outer membrane lipoprotein-sorting protein